MNRDLTKGPVVRSMLLFAIPMILGDLLQQCYNIADTLIVGRVLGRDALAAVGSSFTLMTFLTSILLGLCMGSGALVSMRFGQRDEQALRENLCASFLFIALVTAALTALAFVCLDALHAFLRVPADVWGDMRAYLFVIFMGIPAVFLLIAGGQRLNFRVHFGLAGRVGAAVQAAEHQHHAGKRAADLPHTAHAAAKPHRQFQCLLLTHAHFPCKGRRDRLTAIIPLMKQGNGFFSVLRHIQLPFRYYVFIVSITQTVGKEKRFLNILLKSAKGVALFMKEC